MGLLTKKNLLTKQQLEIKQVDLDDGNYVFVKEMTGHERDSFEKSLYVVTGEGKNSKVTTKLDDFRAKLAVCTVCDEKGELLLAFSDYPKLAKSISARNLEKIVNEAQSLNKISEDDKEALTKN